MSRTVVISGTAVEVIVQGGISTPGGSGPAGPPGPTGATASIDVGTTTTGAAGTDALVVNAGSSSSAILNFTIPRGNTGLPGTNGTNGTNGAPGTAATIAVGTVTTGAAGSSAVITNAGTSSAAVFNFTIPRGDAGVGSGDVNGPASSTDNQIALFNGATGKLLKTGALVSTLAPIASPAFTGVPAAPTATAGTNTTQLATTAFVTAAAALKANIASPTFTGTPSAPTATAGTNTTQLATTAFVTAADAMKSNLSDTLNTQTGTAYTLQASDNGKVVELGNASAITLTIPVLTVGFNCLVRQTAAGVPTFTASGTTLRNRQSHTKLAGPWAEASISYRTTTEVVISGDTAA